jgi:predicted dehydrogenase
MSEPKRFQSTQSTRRDFLKASAVAAGASAVGSLSLARSAHAAGDDVLRVGLIGCGGRGTGAAVNALTVDANTKLVAMCDAFSDRLEGSLERIKKLKPEQVTVDDDHKFVGMNVYQDLIDSGVDVVILATPPHFRPMHLEACVAAGKHIFCEKPVAVDAPGIRKVLEATKAAKEKQLNIVSGLCWRYHPAVKATMQQVLDGAIGELLTLQETYNTGTLWHRGHDPEWTEMEYQMRNWYYFTWLSGDHNVEQHVHSLDKALWAMGDKPPTRAWGLGGRQVRTDPKFGDIYDHHAVVYEYDDEGVRVYSYCRQQAGCANDVSDFYVGTKGTCNVLKNRIEGQNPWRYDGPGGNMYDLEHDALFKAIRSGQTINNGQYMAYSTMMAILGRMVDYTGQEITWEDAMNSELDLSPESYTWDADPPVMPDENGVYPVAMPGITKFI